MGYCLYSESLLRTRRPRRTMRTNNHNRRSQKKNFSWRLLSRSSHSTVAFIVRRLLSVKLVSQRPKYWRATLNSAQDVIKVSPRYVECLYHKASGSTA
eukprot:scaffold4724_cov166-Amphora_coffeaeformis.AAC.5